jgi:hypothetical protein
MPRLHAGRVTAGLRRSARPFRQRCDGRDRGAVPLARHSLRFPDERPAGTRPILGGIVSRWEWA